MAFVHTAHGLGRIVASETLRGRTRHKVAGPGFEVWLDAADVREASLGDINEDNSTTLPYNPEPQYPSDMWSHDTTIQPGEQEIDKEERLSPSDSVDFDSRSNRSFPGPDPALFSKNAKVAPWRDQDWDDSPFSGSHDPSDEYLNHPDGWSHQPTEKDYADWEAKHGKGRRAAVEDFALDAPYTSMMGDLGAPYTGDSGIGGGAAHEAGIKDFFNELTHDYKDIPLEVSDVIIPKGLREKLGPEGVEEYLRKHSPGVKDYHVGSLGSKYATWMLAAPEGDDSVSRFRRDPIQEINRLGYLWTGGVEDAEMADYGRLVEADKMLRESAWTDVRRKAQRLRREGRVHVLHRGPGNIYANVEGDTGTYTTMIAKTGNTQSIDKWACSCEWGRWAFQRKISYVGRLCSHGYASYLELQSDEHKGNPGRFHAPKRTAGTGNYPTPEHTWEGRGPSHDENGRPLRSSTDAEIEHLRGVGKHLHSSVTDEFQNYVDDFNDGHIDIDAADNFITMPQHSIKEDPYTDDQVQDIYDYARDNATEREPRNYKMPYYTAAEDGERAKVLRTHPHSLTPDLVEVPRGKDPYFVDVTEDERETTAPDGIMHTGALVDAMGNPYTPAGFWRTADEASAEEDTKKKTPAAATPATSGQSSSSAGQSSTSAGQSSSSSGQSSGQVADPSVATPRVPDTKTEAPQEQQPRKEEYGSGGSQPGMDMGTFTSLAGPVIDSVGGFMGPIGEGIGSAIGNIAGGILGSRRYAEDEVNANGYEVPEGDIEHLRELTDEDRDLGDTDSQNREIADLVDELHEEGFDASPIVASYGLGNQGMGQPGGAFGQPGGGSWADRAFAGSGPDPKYWYDTSENLIDRGAEHIDEVDVTEGSGETNHWNESERPAQGKTSAHWLFSAPDESEDELMERQHSEQKNSIDTQHHNWLNKQKVSRQLWAYEGDGDMSDELLQSVGEEIEGIGQYEQFLDEAHELGDDKAVDAIEDALDDETDHVENFTDALEHKTGMNDVVRRFQASGGGALANDGSGGGNFGDDAIAGQARKFLAKTAGRVYSLAEQQELIDESHPEGARNKPTNDDLRGTHYV